MPTVRRMSSKSWRPQVPLCNGIAASTGLLCRRPAPYLIAIAPINPHLPAPFPLSPRCRLHRSGPWMLWDEGLDRRALVEPRKNHGFGP